MKYQRIFDPVAAWVLTIGIGLLPFSFAPLPWITVGQSKVLFAAGLLALAAIAYAAGRVVERHARLPRDLMLPAAALLPLAYLASVAATGGAAISVAGYGLEPDTLAMVTLAASLFLVGTAIFSSVPEAAMRSLKAFMAGGIVLMLIQVIHIILPSFGFGGALAGLSATAFGGWHEYGMLLAALCLVSIGLARSTEARDPWRYAALTATALSLVLLIHVNFRDVWVVLVLALSALSGFLIYRTYGLGMRRAAISAWLPLASLISAVVLLFAGPWLVSLLPDSAVVKQIDVRPSWQGTYAIGRASLDGVAPFLFGTGPNTFMREWGVHKPVDVNATQFWDVDFAVGVASIPTSFITVGLVGAVAWLLFIGATLLLVLRTWFAREQSHLTDADIAVSIAVIMLLAFHLTSIPGSLTTIVMFLLAAVTLSRSATVAGAVHTFAIPGAGVISWLRTAAIGIVLISAICASWVLARTNLAEAEVNRAIHTYNTTKDAEAAAAHVSRALRINPSDDRAHRVAIELGLMRLRDITAQGTADEAARSSLQQILEQTIQHGLQAVSINGTDRQNWLGLAAVYSELVGSNVEGAYEGARSAYEHALETNPTNPLPLLNLGRLEMLRNQPDEALRRFDQAIALKPDFAAAYYFRSQTLAAKNEFPAALEAGRQAARYASADPEAWYNLGAVAYTAGDFPTSVSALEQALTLQPQYANALYILGLAYYANGATDRSLAAFEALDRIDPGQQVVLVILQNLRAGLPPFGEKPSR